MGGRGLSPCRSKPARNVISWCICSMIKILTIFRSPLVLGMSFCSAILFLLSISYVARTSWGLLQLCFIVGGLIPMLQVWFFLSSGFLFELLLQSSLQHLQMITVTRTAMTSRAKSLAGLLFITAKVCDQTALLNSYLNKRKWTFFFLNKMLLAMAAKPDAECVMSSHLAYLASTIQEGWCLPVESILIHPPDVGKWGLFLYLLYLYFLVIAAWTEKEQNFMFGIVSILCSCQFYFFFLFLFLEMFLMEVTLLF